MRRKLVPSEELTILPSLEDYQFFEAAEAFPFASASTAFSVVNAWWAAEASMLAYREPDAVHEALDEAGIMRSESVCSDGMRCYVLHNDNVVLVAFRDTDLAPCDALQEAHEPYRSRMRRVPGGGMVYGPFLDALERVWEPLAQRLDALTAERPGRPLWMTGHGHGGALATLAALRADAASGAYTFGSPRFADARFARHCPATIYRVVHNNDYAPRLPPELPAYVPAIGGRMHAGELRFIDRRGRLTGALTERIEGGLDRAADALKSSLDTLRGCAWAVRQAARPSTRPPVPWDAIRDHAPIYYAVHLWNTLVEQGGEQPEVRA